MEIISKMPTILPANLKLSEDHPYYTAYYNRSVGIGYVGPWFNTLIRDVYGD